MRPRPCHPSLLFLALAPLLSGCAWLNTFTPDGQARGVVEELREVTMERERLRRQVIDALIAQYLSQVRLTQEAELNELEAQLTLQIYRRVQARTDKERATAKSQLETALLPTLERIRTDIVKENDLIATGQGGSEAKRNQLQVQMAATIVAVQTELERINEEMRSQMDQAREGKLHELEDMMLLLRRDALIEPENVAEEMRGDMESALQAELYLAAVDKGFDQILVYIDNYGAPTLSLSGLLGDAAGGRLVKLVEGKVEQAGDSLRGSIDKALDRFELPGSRFGDDLASTGSGSGS